MNNDGLIVDAGNSQGTATTVTLPYNELGSAGFGADENDYFYFTAAKSGQLSISLSSLADNLDLRLYRESGAHIMSSTNIGNADESLIYQVLAGQSYYFRVDPAGEAESNYRLQATISSGGQRDGGGNDASDFITSARFISLPYADSGSVGFAADQADYYRFISPLAGEITTSLAGLSGDADLHLLNSLGGVIASSTNNGTVSEQISFNAGQGLTYYLHIAPKASQQSDYLLSVTPSDAGTSDGGGSDVSDFFASAPIVDLPYDADGSVGFGDDSNDYYQIQTTGSGKLSVRLDGLSDNIDIRLYNDTNGQLAASQRAATLSESIEFDADPVTTYVIRVNPFSHAESEYHLTMSLTTTQKTYVEQVALLYEAALDRQPDIGGLNYFVGNLEDGQTLQQIANSFYISKEFRDQFTDFNDPSYINQLYLNVLDRGADEEGFAYWEGQLARGLTQADILFSFAESAENYTNATDWLVELEYDPVTDLWLI